MKNVKGFWLPDEEKHLSAFLESGPEFARGPTYQFHKLAAAVPLIKNFRHAVDVGAHCGLWSRPLAAMFRRLTAFEPIDEHRKCFEWNIAGATDFEHSHTRLLPYALGERADRVNLAAGVASTGDTRIGKGEYFATMRTMDSFNLPPMDFLKIDVEGYELFVIKGGEKTIRRDQPTMVVEQKPNKAVDYGIGDTDAVKLLESWGAKLKWTISGDYCLAW